METVEWGWKGLGGIRPGGMRDGTKSIIYIGCAKRRFGKGWRGRGPAECAMAAYFASRKQVRILSSAGFIISAYCFHTAEPARGWPYSTAPRIPPGRKKEEGRGEREQRRGKREEGRVKREEERRN